MTTLSNEIEASGSTPPGEADDFYRQTSFVQAAKSYGGTSLLLTFGTLGALLAGGAILYLYLDNDLSREGVKALGVAYLSLGAALFGIVLAGLAVVAAFFDREYVLWLRERGSLRPSFFLFWWVAALAVGALLASVALTVAAYAGHSRPVTATLLTVATVLFVSTLLEALALVGTMMRHGLYRAEFMALDIKVRRGTGGTKD